MEQWKQKLALIRDNLVKEENEKTSLPDIKKKQSNFDKKIRAFQRAKSRSRLA